MLYKVQHARTGVTLHGASHGRLKITLLNKHSIVQMNINRLSNDHGSLLIFNSLINLTTKDFMCYLI